MSEIRPIDYVLGELEAGDLEEAERLLGADPAFRAEVERLSPMAGALSELPSEAWQDLAPPALTVPGIEAERPRPRTSLFPRLAIGMAGVLAAGVAIGFVLTGSGEDPSEPPEGPSVTLEPYGDASAGSGTLTRTAPDEASLSLSDMPPSGSDEFYEVWLLDGTEKVVSLGSVRIDESGQADLMITLPENPDSYRYFDVSIEKTDADPSHSGNSVLRGQT